MHQMLSRDKSPGMVQAASSCCSPGKGEPVDPAAPRKQQKSPRSQKQGDRGKWICYWGAGAQRNLNEGENFRVEGIFF